MSFYNFKYSAKIGSNSSFASSGFFASMGQIEIKSNSFSSLESCEHELSRLLLSLINIERKTNTANFVLMKKLNPLYDAEASEPEWDSSILFRFYATDADKLKKSILDYPFMGEVTGITPEYEH